MRSDEWQRVSNLFERALDLAPFERAAWLAGACEDRALRARVERMLAADAAAADFLERPSADIGADVAADVAAGEDDGGAFGVAAGAVFGAYRTLASLGAGGMGEVWLAERADGEFEQRVAIKRLLYPTPELVRRFLNERRVLAGLHHPRIAALFDGGVAADGSPYFVMEYVEGVAITAYCQSRAGGIEARIGLLLQVCDAVQYAHRNLVVHRDLKPSNILVTADGQVKLLDFGIAKVLEVTGDGDATVTTVQRLTPDYAAPEQIRGDAVTTATDVYALGVLLFELLAGDRPYRVGGSRLDLQCAILQSKPALPSALAARAGKAWARKLTGDLDRITMKAMAKEPERRYASVGALADDLDRWLGGRPILARGDDALYRARKFVGRNRVVVGAATVVVWALIAAATISLRQAHHAGEQASRAEAEKAFVLGILDANDPNLTQGRQLTLTAREILDRAAERVGTDLADQPVVRAELYDEIGNLYWDYGLFERAQPLFERAVALAQTADVADDQRVTYLIDLGQDQQIQRHLSASEATFREALDVAQARLGENAPQACDARGYLSETLAYAGRFAEAGSNARASVACVLLQHPKTSDEYAHALDRIAFAEMEGRHYPESVALHREELAVYERAHPELNSTVSTTLNELGLALIGSGRIGEAEAVLRHALDRHERLLGKQHPYYAGTQSNLAAAVDLAGRFEEAKRLLDESLKVRALALGEDSFVLAGTWRHLGLNALHRGDLAVAEIDARRAVALDVKAYGEENQASLESNLLLGMVVSQAGRSVEAQSILRRAIATADRLFGSAGDACGYARALLARSLAGEGRFDEAQPLFEQALTMLHASVGEAHYETADALTWKGEAEAARGGPALALATSLQALDSARSAYPEGDVLIADAQVLRGRAELAAGQSVLGVASLQEALALRRAALPPGDARVADVMRLLSDAGGEVATTAAAAALKP